MEFIIFLGVFLVSSISASTEFSSRIVGGEEAEPHEFPHQVSLQWNFNNGTVRHFCGGSVLNEFWILTAAHCRLGYSRVGFIEVVAGEHNLRDYSGFRQRIPVKKFIVHEKYGGRVGPDDIALIQLKHPLDFNIFVQAVALPKAGAIPSGNAVISGWGSTSITKIPTYPIELGKATLPLHSYEDCYHLWFPSTFSKGNICAGPLNGSPTVCSGDSGGPLVQYNFDRTVTQIGVVSWGRIPCGSPKKPGVFVRVSHYTKWISHVIKGHSPFHKGFY